VAAGSSTPAGLTTSEEGTAATATADTAASTYIAEAVSVYDDESRALVVLDDGRVLAAGYTSNTNDTDFVLLRYSAVAVDTLADAASRAAGDVANTNYLIRTTPITNISRNSAMSGGSIAEKSTGTSSTLTVTARGVCYGTARHPVYRLATATTTGSTTATTTTTGTTTDTTAILPAVSKDTAYNYETVLSGQTSDGTGVGSFGSNIVKITPNTVYYVRAYGVLSDNTVIYGNELSFETSDACFIATAAYGSLLDNHVILLRNFRDRFLKTNYLGRTFINVYYKFSPEIAKTIEHSEGLKQLVRFCLWPWVAFSYIMLHCAGLVKITMVLLGALMGGGALYRITIKRNVRKYYDR
jgi:hypothetical protein